MKADKNVVVEMDEENSNEIEEIVLNQEQIEKWKQKYGKIYRTVVGDITVIWRVLRRSEYVDTMIKEDLNNSPDKRVFDRQEELVKKVCLYPSDISELIEEIGGLATCLSGEISEKSGFSLPLTSEL